MRRELDVTDISGQADVGGVEFTTRTIAAQVVPGVSGSVVASTPTDFRRRPLSCEHQHPHCWRCQDGHLTCVGSRAELGKLAGRDLSSLDPHRPYIDDVTFACPTCGEQSSRVSEVIDAWFDSGSMPFASIGYPYADDSVERFEKSYPAQFICEAIDQTRGWFYTLMAIGTLVFGRSSYENVVCLGHIVAEDGRKMSKHFGNVIEPIPFMEKHGADALRWFMLCTGSPWSARRVDDAPLEEIVRKSC